MEIASARLVYSPFKSKLSGHVYVIFTMHDGEEIAISPEADVKQGDTYSMMRGMVRTYQLRYLVVPHTHIANELKSRGRDLHEYPLPMSTGELKALYASMCSRAEALKTNTEWYNTLFNSCVTNMVRHLDDARQMESSWLKYPRLVLRPYEMADKA